MGKANKFRSFADAASPWEQTGAGDPNTQPEVSLRVRNGLCQADVQNFKIPPPPPKEEKKDEKK
jgi:NADH dehydrogenase (ubiquinone) Fe-S protein 3